MKEKWKLLRFVFAVLCLLPVCANAIIIKDFNTNGQIVDGNEFYTVNVRNNAMVDMLGGLITFSINTYNTSVLNISGGTLHGGIVTINMSESSVLNLSGGLFYNTWIYPNTSTVNIYGRDLTWVIDSEKRVHGYWADDTEFLITLARIENANIVFYEIPEPVATVFLLIGILGVRKVRG